MTDADMLAHMPVSQLAGFLMGFGIGNLQANPSQTHWTDLVRLKRLSSEDEVKE